MSELSQIAGNHGVPYSLETPDGTVTFSLITQAVKIEFEKALYAQAKDALREDRAEMGDEWYERKLDALREQYEAGEYAFESERGKKALRNATWAVRFLQMITRLGGTPLTWEKALDLMASHGAEVKNILAQVLKDSFPSLRLAEQKAAKGKAKKGGDPLGEAAGGAK